MQVTTALLCDAASVRESLLHILGGGVTRLWRQGFPSQMACALAVQVRLHPAEATKAHEVEVILQTEDGQKIAEAGVGFKIESSGVEPGESHHVPFVAPLHDVVLPAAGAYSIEILIDGTHQASLPFRAVLRAGDGGLQGHGVT